MTEPTTGKLVDLAPLAGGAERLTLLAEGQKSVLEIGAKLREMRIAARTTQYELAELSGIPYWRIRQIEQGSGRQGPDVETVARLSAVLGRPLVIVEAAELQALRDRLAALERESANPQRDLAQDAWPAVSQS
jgi:transcriptional regulator with XRE-family HTH domain